MTILKRAYLIFVLFPTAIVFTIAVIVKTIFHHIIDQCKISKY